MIGFLSKIMINDTHLFRWDSKSSDIMERALFHKFTQDSHLLRIILATCGAVMVEASPTDKKWGIGKYLIFYK